jgi:murE/murF fusion protein
MEQDAEDGLELIWEAIEQGRIAGVTSNSQEVRPGYVFVAIPGSRVHGCAFISDAVKNGAVFVVMPRDVPLEALPNPFQYVRVIQVQDTRVALGCIAVRFYGNKAAGLQMVGITGTNGKTTISYLLESILKKAGKETGVIGTINTRFKGSEYPSKLTTPDVVTLHKILAEMSEAGVNSVVMEVSSHALDQKRVAGCHFDVAIFTNLTHDHLDYHKDMEAYYQAKRRLLFEYTPKSVIINIDDPYGKRLWNELTTYKISYGFDDHAMVRPLSYTSDFHGIQMEVATPIGQFSICSALVGHFNISNLLAAIAAAIGLGIKRDDIQGGILSLTGVPGRLEPVRVAKERGVHAFVDYAHTPDALSNVLTVLSNLKADGRLFCVFGCGGDRDAAKRPVMARIVAGLADEMVMTSDNPRSEDPHRILLEMWQGLFPWPQNRNCRVHVEPDRKKAIAMACSLVKKGDCILVAGKGHETYQEIAGVRHPFDDRLVLQEVLQNTRPVLPEFTFEDITTALGVSSTVALRPGLSLHSISTDTRRLYPSQIFWALNGPHFKGAEFVQQAIQKGAACAVVNAEDKGLLQAIPQDFPLFFVRDSLYALGEMARFHRKRGSYRVIGVTGSCGKTTTKELIASILGQRAQVLKTQGNYNNLIGLPLTLLASSGHEDWAVLEMGMNQPGEIQRLCEIAGPQVAVVTNVRPVHLEGLGDIYGVLREKLELWRSVSEQGLVVVNLDDPLLVEQANGLNKTVQKIGYSTSSTSADVLNLNGLVFLKDWSVLSTGTQVEFGLKDVARGREEVFSARLQLIGLANLQNALCATATAIGLGCDIQVIQRGLEAVVPVKGRLEFKNLGQSVYLIDDTYNANPASMELAIQTLKLWGRGERWAVLGDMFELGEDAALYHAKVGELVKASGVKRLLAVGGFAEVLAQAALKVGMVFDAVSVYKDTQTLVEAIKSRAIVFSQRDGGEVTVLFKASRGMGLERAVQALTEILKRD